MKNKVILSLTFIIIIVIVIIGGVIFINKNEENNYIYKITYSDDAIPGNQYDIYIYNNYDIKVEKQLLCSTKECIEENKFLHKSKFKVNFNKKNKQLIKKYIQNLFKDNKTKELELTYYDLEEKELIVIESIIYDNEEYLNEINKLENLIFEVHSSRFNCLTVSLNVYNDNTYRYIYTYGINGENPKYKEGTYTYDVSKLLGNINNYDIPEKNIGPFILTMNDKSYEIYDNNLELQEFLQSISTNLDKCLEFPN